MENQDIVPSFEWGNGRLGARKVAFKEFNSTSKSEV